MAVECVVGISGSAILAGSTYTGDRQPAVQHLLETALTVLP